MTKTELFQFLFRLTANERCEIGCDHLIQDKKNKQTNNIVQPLIQIPYIIVVGGTEA